MTKEEVDHANRVYDLEQEQRYIERNIRKYKRLAMGSIAPENRGKYKDKLRYWTGRQDKLLSAHGDILKRSIEAERVFTDIPYISNRRTNKALTNAQNGGTMLSGAVSGALNPESREALEHAQRYYAFIRRIKTDVKHIAENTGFSENQIQEIKIFLFLEKHQLDSGLDYFFPNYDMAQSWQRLIDGKNIQQHDITAII